MQLLWRKAWQFLQKLKMELSYEPAIPLLGHICSENSNLKRYMNPMSIWGAEARQVYLLAPAVKTRTKGSLRRGTLRWRFSLKLK